MAVLVGVHSSSTLADQRKFVWAYEPVLQFPGAADLEFYQTTRFNQTDSWEYRLEVEHGLTKKWDLSVYQIFAQKENEAFKWDAFQIRTRVRLSEIGTTPFDPVLYLEYRRRIDSGEQNKLETKLLLGKRLQRFTIALNPVYEFFWAPGDPIHEIGLDVGMAYSPAYNVSLGLESTTRHEFIKSNADKTATYLGPSMSFASGPIWYSLGYVWGLNDDGDDSRARFLMGAQL